MCFLCIRDKYTAYTTMCACVCVTSFCLTYLGLVIATFVLFIRAEADIQIVMDGRANV